MDTLRAKVESVYLAYSFSSLGKDFKISLNEKLGFVTGKSKSTTDKLIAGVDLKFSENNVPLALGQIGARPWAQSINLSFILGFFFRGW